MRMQRYDVAGFVLAALCVWGCESPPSGPATAAIHEDDAEKESGRPNVVLIVTDELPADTVGVGALADSGIRFLEGQALPAAAGSAPWSSAAIRSSLLTGLHPEILGLRDPADLGSRGVDDVEVPGPPVLGLDLSDLLSEVIVKTLRPPVMDSNFCPRASRAANPPSNSVPMFRPVWASFDTETRKTASSAPLPTRTVITSAAEAVPARLPNTPFPFASIKANADRFIAAI